MPRLPVELEIPIALTKADPQPLWRQLATQLRCAIQSGRLAKGSMVASSRQLAQQLKVSRTVTTGAYEALLAEGYLVARPGVGTFVATAVPQLARSEQPQRGAPRWLKPSALKGDPTASGALFRLGAPSLEGLDRRLWRRLWRSVSAETPPHDYLDPAGEAALRAAVASYLGRTRGIACAPDEVVITAGTAQAVELIRQVTLAPGEAVAFENPGYRTVRDDLQRSGAVIHPVPVDADGLVVAALPTDPAPKLIYTTPAHQYPLGYRLTLARRLALIDWAQRCDSLIIEDDYDGEFRYDTAPLPPLASLEHGGCVAYIGTLSKVLMPGLRLGYLVASQALIEAIVARKRGANDATPWPVQRAVGRLLQTGELERHIRKQRRRYGAKRAALQAQLAPLAPLARLRGLEAGLHAFLQLDAALSPVAVAELAAQRGAAPVLLDHYCCGEVPHHGLLLGYGHLTMEQLKRGCELLTEAIRALVPLDFISSS